MTLSESAGAGPAAAPSTIARTMRLLQLGDSMLPIGTFAFSNALESAIQQAVVTDATTLHTFVRAMTRQAARGDGIGLLHAHRAASAGDLEAAMAADRAIFERKLNEEARTMSVRMGRKLAEVSARMGTTDPAAAWLTGIADGRTPGTFPATLGVVLALQGAPEEDAFAIHQYGTAFMILSAALRLMRVDHLAVQDILFQVDALAPSDHAEVVDSPLDAMATFVPMVDVLAAIHVGSHVRLFMS
jgi:urease accessory protein